MQSVTGNGVYSSPAVAADGTSYVGSNDGKLYAIAANGKGLTNFPCHALRHDVLLELKVRINMAFNS